MSRSPWRPLDLGLSIPAVGYLLLVVLMLAAMTCFTRPVELGAVVTNPDLQYAAGLTFITCTVSTALALLFGLPLGFRLARRPPHERMVWELLLDVPVLLPPMVVGIGLLILLTRCGLRSALYTPIAVILAQTVVATAFSARVIRATFAQIDPRPEHVALTLGAGPWTTFWKIALPQARGGIVQAATLAFARSLGEFGPVLILAGTTRRKTEVLSSSVYLAFTEGDLDQALAISLLMVAFAFLLLFLSRLLTPRTGGGG